jgi:hypothetical protein
VDMGSQRLELPLIFPNTMSDTNLVIAFVGYV